MEEGRGRRRSLRRNPFYSDQTEHDQIGQTSTNRQAALFPDSQSRPIPTHQILRSPHSLPWPSALRIPVSTRPLPPPPVPDSPCTPSTTRNPSDPTSSSSGLQPRTASRLRRLPEKLPIPKIYQILCAIYFLEVLLKTALHRIHAHLLYARDSQSATARHCPQRPENSMCGQSRSTYPHVTQKNICKRRHGRCV